MAEAIAMLPEQQRFKLIEAYTRHLRRVALFMSPANLELAELRCIGR